MSTALVSDVIYSSLASPDAETTANSLVLVGHGVSSDIQRLEETKISTSPPHSCALTNAPLEIPHNVLIVDTASFERALFNAGERGVMHDPKTGKHRAQGSTLSLGGLLHSLGIEPPCALHNAGNDAFLCLLALQKMMEPGTATPMPDTDARKKSKAAGLVMAAPMPVAFMGHLSVVDDGYWKSLGRSGSPRVRERERGVVDGVTDEMGLMRRGSKYGSMSPPEIGGSWKDDRDKEKEGWFKSAKGVRLGTK